ncbi:clock-controlled protein 8 [Rhypophila decipiens]
MSFADSPGTELPPIQSRTDKLASPSNHTLPSLSSVTGGPPPPLPPIHQRQPEPITHWPSLNPLTAFYTPSHVEPPRPVRSMATSPDRSYGQRAESVNPDDAKVIEAAEALGQLRADFQSSPPPRSTPLPGISPDPQADHHPEPLLSLITTTLPIMAGPVKQATELVENATSLYNTGKNMSPAYVKSRLDSIESMVGNVSRNVSRRANMQRTSLRDLLYYRGRKKASDPDGDHESRKRRKTNLTQKEVEAIGGLSGYMDLDNDRRMSISTVDTLPAYDDLSSPAYTEAQEGANRPTSRPGSSSGLQQRIMVSTSSLAVTVTTQARGKLKQCLGTLRHLNGAIARGAEELRRTAEQYDAVAAKDQDGDRQATAGDRSRLMAQMHSLRKDIFSSMETAIKVMSEYGTYLPQNVQCFVRDSVMSIPGRFPFQAWIGNLQEGKMGANQETAARKEASLVLDFAKEGLQTITTVTNVMETTLVSAEQWIDSLGKKKEAAGSPLSTAESAFSPSTTTVHFSTMGSPTSTVDLDVTMSEAR